MEHHLAIVFAAVGFVVVFATWVSYFRTIPRGQVPIWPLGSIISQGLGMALAVAGVAWWLAGYGSPVVLAPALPAIGLGLFFYWLLGQRKTPIGDLKVEVGGKLIPFSAVTAEGGSFSTDEFAGNRVLLKFFRGGW